jgi:hypothetical protein
VNWRFQLADMRRIQRGELRSASIGECFDNELIRWLVMGNSPPDWHLLAEVRIFARPARSNGLPTSRPRFPSGADAFTIPGVVSRNQPAAEFALLSRVQRVSAVFVELVL